MSSDLLLTTEFQSGKKRDVSPECDVDQKFRDIVYDFIERIGREVVIYDDGGSNINANDFKHIELQIQAKRVEKVLQLSIIKIRQLFLLSHLIENQRDHLVLFFPREDVSMLEMFAVKWFNSLPDPANVNFNADLNRCFLAIEGVENEWKTKVSNSARTIVMLLSQLSQVARYRIEASASTDMAKQKVLHHLWAVNTKHMRKINQIRREIEEDEMKISSVLSEKRNEIERYEFEKQRLTHQNTMALNRLIIQSNRAMVEICEIGKCHQSATTESVMRAKEMFDTLRKNDICEEKEAIQRKIDLENQLKDFLIVYDQEIGARSSKLRDCRHTLKAESNTLAEWKEKYKIQEVLYNQIQADKEAEEEKRREEKILLFMMNRVARIIQRSYRRILAQRKAKKKGKGKKGGKGKK